MSRPQLRIRTPSRLHFGLLSFGQPDQRQYGGAGVMIEQPGIELWASTAEQFTTGGVYAERIEHAAQRWQAFYRCVLPACRIAIASAPRQHVGLGVGTQLALAVVAALNGWTGRPMPSAAELSASAARGARSAIGVYGFLEGGLIVERGKLPQESLSPLDCRLDLPAEWRFILATPQIHSGLSGAAEAETFAQLSPVPIDVSQRLADELRLGLVPAAARGDFPAFSASLYRYGHEAGLCYAAVQGGPYHGPLVTSLVAQLREIGVQGVGQTSWGPTVFALAQNSAEAEHIAGHLARKFPQPLELVITAVANQGAQLDWIGA